MNHFTFLGTNINFMLDYSTHIKEANKSDGAMGFIWDGEKDVLKTE